MSGFSLLLSEKIQDYYFVNTAAQFDLSIDKVGNLYDKLVDDREKFFESNGDKFLKSLFNKLDFDLIDQLYRDDLSPKFFDREYQLYERFLIAMKAVFYNYHYKHSYYDDIRDNKIFICSFYGHYGVDQILNRFKEIFGKRVICCFDNSVSDTILFINFGVSTSVSYDCAKMFGYKEEYIHRRFG